MYAAEGRYEKEKEENQNEPKPDKREPNEGKPWQDN